jgi:hypothetical protein
MKFGVPRLVVVSVPIVRGCFPSGRSCWYSVRETIGSSCGQNAYLHAGERTQCQGAYVEHLSIHPASTRPVRTTRAAGARVCSSADKVHKSEHACSGDSEES